MRLVYKDFKNSRWGRQKLRAFIIERIYFPKSQFGFMINILGYIVYYQQTKSSSHFQSLQKFQNVRNFVFHYSLGLRLVFNLSKKSRESPTCRVEVISSQIKSTFLEHPL